MSSTPRALRFFLLVLLLLGVALSSTVQAGEEIVAFNTQSRKYHCLTCSSAIRCTKSCIRIEKSEARDRGGVPCQRCHGSCEE